ncbi:hypothetical protein H696_05826 [Fonticula alba]|uniref:VWFD domain-containing protein n=1 Tax=Fonticula alba TaxID=691883 RepID=A0A058Z1A0_FONAL|nr:hypothetical protein H696_05826 [Fonticula alba]KCV67718.1 hypothetical protein H696_05826 [Fonticula alba]|eukprot:XP_009497902.1 hypothetical protein H696_05826 [Fonticula alba]
MSRSLFLSALFAMLAMVALAGLAHAKDDNTAAVEEVLHDGIIHEDVPGIRHCKCTKSLKCFDNLGNCVNHYHAKEFPNGGGRVQCITNGLNMPFYSCDEMPDLCFNTATCDPVREVHCNCRKEVICYDSAADCRRNHNPLKLKAGDRNQCRSHGKTVYACAEEPGVCRSVSNCKRTHGGNVTQDPHLVGFGGESFYFEGQAGRDWNIISDPGFQLNAHFIRLHSLKGTYMGRIGMLFGDQSLAFDPHFGAFVNGTHITEGSMSFPQAEVTVDHIDGRYRMTARTATWQVIARTVIEQGALSEAYVNLHASLVGTPEDPHGILGQTARFAMAENDLSDKPLRNPGAPFQLDGEEADYEVKDGLFGTNFKYNRFGTTDENGKKKLPLRASVDGHPKPLRQSRSLFEATVDM